MPAPISYRSRFAIFFSRPAILALCCWMAAVCINYTNRKIYPPQIREELQFIPERTVVDFLSFGHKGFAADLLFIKVSGSLTWKPDRFNFNNEWSYQMINLVTDLDPKYYTAYLFSGMALLHNHEDIFRSIPIIKKGMAIFPDSWELPFWIGLNAYLYLENDAMASEFLWLAAHKPNAPTSFLSLLLSAITKGGNFEKGVWVLESLIKNEKNPKIQLVYRKRVARLHNFIDLQKAAEMYKSRFGDYPENLERLVATGIIQQIPQDPMARPYRWNKVKQRVECQEPVGVTDQ